MARTIAITGATGLIGGAVARALVDRGDRVIALVRRPPRPELPPSVEQRAWTASDPVAPLQGAEAVVNLVGASVAAGRWTEARKRRIVESRIAGTRSVVEGIRAEGGAVRVLVSASAIGFYGDTGVVEIDEDSPPGSGFLADLSRRWEAGAVEASGLGARVVQLRTGVVLAREGGALAKLEPIFRLGLGGPVGSGEQLVPWIHLDDEVGLILHVLDRDDLEGPMICAAPNPVSSAVFAKEIGHALGRPAILPVPTLALRALFGEMASLFLGSNRAAPAKALETGYRFRYPEIRPALEAAISSGRASSRRGR
ncbi:TIGR01777 family oxidoreductase [Vulgatibacter incomptus]|uniref:Cell division inhibitor n=1 Tax=Vulgatibacter incomptus TaxID=1391653 RepID=A0A0K1PD33_9BACT|nr:TIGR01777 family oxidoreductase [Vulgatibacter incomptus]AKU91430.1 Cell division inhibitor [Vulgatibacter incomptus]